MLIMFDFLYDLFRNMQENIYHIEFLTSSLRRREHLFSRSGTSTVRIIRSSNNTYCIFYVHLLHNCEVV